MNSDPLAPRPGDAGNDDAVWADLVARLETPQHKSVGDFDPLGVWGGGAPTPPPEPPSAPAPRELGPRDYAAAEVADEFVPEPLPSLAGAEPALLASWIGAVGGPLFLVFSAIFWRSVPLLIVVAVIAAFVAGTAYLLYRLPNQHDHDGNDGAVV